MLMTLGQVERFSRLLEEAMAMGAEMRSVARDRKLRKFRRRTGLPHYWAWAYEFTLPELIGLIAHATNTLDSFLAAIKSPDAYESLLEWIGRLDADADMPRVKYRQFFCAQTMLYAFFHSIESIGFYSLSINELVRLGQQGDMLALRRAIAVDPTVINTPSATALISDMALRGERKELAKLYSAAAKGPNKQLRPYQILRYMERVIAEGKVIEAHGREVVFNLVTERLRLYDAGGKDPFKGLFVLFGRWRESATT